MADITGNSGTRARPDERGAAARIAAHAARAPHRRALVLVPAGGDRAGTVTLTYGRLDEAARSLAPRLLAHAGPGGRAVLAATGPDFAVSLLACLYAGVTAVPVGPPSGDGPAADRLAGVVRDSGAGCLLADREACGELSRLLAAAGRSRTICLDAAAPGPDPAPLGPSPSPVPGGDPPLLLQYAAGPVRSPQGVEITAAALMARHRALVDALGTGSDDVIGGCLPLHEEMGLLAQLLHPWLLGATAVAVAPAAFAADPLVWPRALDEHRVAVTVAPDSAFDQCARRAAAHPERIRSLDLSALRTALSGAEPPRPGALTGFAACFAAAGLDPRAVVPCYGPAEAPLLSAGSVAVPAGPALRADPEALAAGRLDPAAPGTPGVLLAHSGPPRATLRVTGAGGVALTEGRVGEIWVRADTVGRGYFRRPPAHFRAFADTPGARWLRTGDLGAIREGLLYVTGRLGDVIVADGRRLHPQDLERTVAATVPGGCAAVGVPCEGRERPAVLHECAARDRYRLDLPGLVDAIRESLAEQHGVRPAAVLLLRPGTLPRAADTVDRPRARRLFLAGRLRALSHWYDPALPEPAVPAATRASRTRDGVR